MTIDKERLTAYFEYLDKLRESGATNMFGAAPYIADEFLISQNEARQILKHWMETFGDGKESASVRAAKVN